MLENFEPALGRAYSEIPDSDETDVERAVQAASRAAPGWAATPVVERARILNKLADLIHRDTAALALAESRDSGKPITLGLHARYSAK